VSGLLDQGFRVTVFHRGQTRAALPQAAHEVFGDRSHADQLLAALGDRSFDVVVDTTLYTGEDARAAARIFQSRVRRYIVLSTGQVYLVRSGLCRPFQEKDYKGATIPAPSVENALEYEEWRYGIDKRAAEDALMMAHREHSFPVTVFRLPMVNSERDHFHRIAGYLARLRDGGPILIPQGPHLKLRHVYGGDVVRAVLQRSTAKGGYGEAYNLSQDEEVSIEAFLEMLAGIAGTGLRVARAPRERLELDRLLPDCSPFSGAWMSTLDNRRSKQELGMTYAPLAEYLPRLVTSIRSGARVPPGYSRRPLELQIARD
jgi:nucleoside-diphosphate-sugar epimerase